MKKSKIIIVFALSILFLGCNKSAHAKSSKTASPEPAPKIDPRVEKLNSVLENMSPRFKSVVLNGTNDMRSYPDEFFADLEAVLAFEKETSEKSGDLSLYYLIDKKHNVGADYEPKNLRRLEKNDDYVINRNDLSLRPDAEDALRVLSRAAKADGITLVVSSTYRSYSYQEKLFQRWVNIDGLEEAERESARAGTSQHQLGAAIDFGSIEDDYAETRPGKWLSANAEKYGFSLSFPKEYEDVTGYRWECWHYRYIGIPACEFQKKWFGNVQQFMIEFIDAWKNM